MPSQKGFSQIVVIVLVVAALIGGVVLLTVKNKPSVSTNQQKSDHEQPRQSSDHPQQSSDTSGSSQAYGYRTPFYSKDGVSFAHYWPRDFYAPSMKADETEIQIYNESSQTVEFKSIKVEYLVDGQKALEKSGTWEKFPSRTSWEKTQYVNISPAYYKGESLILNPGEKGKIHHHIEAGRDIPSAKDQKVQINLVYTLGGEEVTLEKELVRTTPPAEGSSPQEDH